MSRFQFQDIRTVIWKERKSLLWTQGTRWRAVLPLLSPLFLAIYIPWQAGLDWLQSYVSLLVCFVVPLLLVGISVPESFAGERERHTLPTLLASRLSDGSIVLGKLIACIAFSFVALTVALVIGLAVANASDWQGHFVFYRPAVLLMGLGAAFLVALLAGSAGILISLRSKSVQGATQALLGIFFVPPLLLSMAVMFLRESMIPLVERLSFMATLGTVLGVIATIDVVLTVLVFTRFQRSQLLSK